MNYSEAKLRYVDLKGLYINDMAAKQLAGPVELFKGSWEIFQNRWKTLAAIQLPMLVFIPLGVIVVILVGSTTLLYTALVVGILVSVLVQLWAQVALIFAIKDSKEGIGFKESYKRAWRVLRSYLWVSLLVGLSVLGGFLLLVIPGFIFMVWFGLAGYIVIDRGTKGTAALKASKALVKGKFWAVVLRFLVIGVLGLVLVSVREYLDKSWENTSMAWVGGVGTIIVSLLWTAYTGVYVWLLYTSLRESRGS